MTNAPMTRDDAANLYRRLRACAVRHGYTVERFDYEVVGTVGENPTYADWVEAAYEVESNASHEWDDRIADMGSAFWGAVGGGMSHADAFALAHQRPVVEPTGWDEDGW